jgi:predicted dehydrogenase
LHDKQINSIEFTRISESCSGEPYFELAIHDLDLMTYLMGIKHITFDYFKCIGKIYEAKLNYGNTTCMFSWGIGSNCRMIKISYNDEQLIVDLVNLTITSKLGIEIFNDSPLRLEHDAFLNNEYLTDVKYSHELMIGLLQC